MRPTDAFSGSAGNRRQRCVPAFVHLIGLGYLRHERCKRHDALIWKFGRLFSGNFDTRHCAGHRQAIDDAPDETLAERIVEACADDAGERREARWAVLEETVSRACMAEQLPQGRLYGRAVRQRYRHLMVECHRAVLDALEHECRRERLREVANVVGRVG